jgi:hypothetical protein
LFFLQHFRGGLDNWDPLITDGLAADREVILFNGRGSLHQQVSHVLGLKIWLMMQQR